MLSSWLSWPIALEFLTLWEVAALWAALAAVIVLLGMRSMGGQSRGRRWTAIGLRLGLAALAVLVLGGVKWKSVNHDLTVMVLRDVSDSTSLVRDYPTGHDDAPGVQGAVDQFLKSADQMGKKRTDDKLGQISFAENAQVDALPSARPQWDSGAVRPPGDGTDPAAAIQLGLAAMPQDTMRRMLLIWDGNSTVSHAEMEQAVAAAAARHVPIDVMPLHYQVTHEVSIERLAAPPWKSPDEIFTIDVVLKSTNARGVSGKLSVRMDDAPLDMDASEAGVQPWRMVRLNPGITVVRLAVGPLKQTGAHLFHALLEPQEPADGKGAIDTLSQNNAADAFTFIHGQGRILLVDGMAGGAGRSLAEALTREHMKLDVRSPEDFPTDLASLQSYDAVVMQNAALGMGGLSSDQDEILADYVRELGGGLVMVGGDQAFGAGGWQGSKTEAVLPVNMDIPAKRELPRGALLLVLDHSGSMGESIKGSNLDKEHIADESAVQAVKALSRQDYVGVIAFDSQPTWIVPLGVNAHPDKTNEAIRQIGPGGGTEIYPALVEAYNAMRRLDWNIVGVKHILLLTDGNSNAGDFDGIARAIQEQHMTLSTIGIGDDVDSALLQRLATLGGGAYYAVSNPHLLPQIFVKEATIVRRTLIQTNDAGIPVRTTESAGSSQAVAGITTFPPIKGLVLTTVKNNPLVHEPLVAGANNDPLLAHWQVGLGRALAFTSDASAIWDPQWVGSAMYDKLWAQSVRLVARPPMGNDVELHSTVEGSEAHLSVEAFNADGTHRNFLSLSGVRVDPDGGAHPIRMLQTGPGIYDGRFPTMQKGDYLLRLTYRDEDGKQGVLLSGLAVNGSQEMRDLSSNDYQVEQVAMKTGGRILRPFDAQTADLFSTKHLTPAVSMTPIWNRLIPFLLLLLLIDVAVRRIAWDYAALRRAAMAAAGKVRRFTVVREVQTRQSVDALRKVRDQSAATARPQARVDIEQITAHDGARRDVPDLIGQAPAADTSEARPSDDQPAEEAGHMGSLLEAKRRARRNMR